MGLPKGKRASKSKREPKSEEPSNPKRGPKAAWVTKLKRAPKAAGAAKTKQAQKTKPAPRSARRGRDPLRLLARLLAVLCAFVLMVAFAVVLAQLTLQPSPASEALTHTNLRPGRSLKAYLDQPELRDAVKQIGGNLLLGVPFGILAPVVAPRTRGPLRILLLTATVMLLVELVQGLMVAGRAFDIDDVILNTTGALIGYLVLGRRMSRAVHARERRS
ncbi:VanZ family protein [Streptomyces sp. DG2A-72]|uniref:VanZ family protein n=1 Tax=Streptomyces sp. DG2A-72 TaxID=3051386 RepID=UPI00265C7DB8|nr:VanZ family protein [Streptomyces sp. DG2A-72]MDO0938669.1 VanZ family protein [Streptomyces sp. DG2A-72]